MTVLDVVTRAMFDLGVLQEGEVPTPDQATECLNALNEWIDGLTPDTLTVYTVTRSTWTITTATSYTVGTGGAVNIARPNSPNDIEHIGYVDNNFSPAQESLLTLLSDDEYASIPQKTLTSALPTSWYYNPTYPLGTLHPFPVPSSSNLLGVIYTRTAVTEFSALTDTVSLPPGYRRFFRSNLALEISPIFNAQPTPALVQMAQESAQRIRTANVRPSELSSDAAALFHAWPWYNIYTG